MKNKIGFGLLLSIVAMITISSAISFASADPVGRPFSNKVVYVTSQSLYYDTIVPVSPDKQLPDKGPFQELEMAGPTGLQTEFGLGDQDYLGGRWWIDANANDEMDPGDVYFLCPLLGPGRDSP